jgi:hypothetical protein
MRGIMTDQHPLPIKQDSRLLGVLSFDVARAALNAASLENRALRNTSSTGEPDSAPESSDSNLNS